MRAALYITFVQTAQGSRWANRILLQSKADQNEIVPTSEEEPTLSSTTRQLKQPHILTE